MGFLIRIAVAVALVAATWNPTGTSYVHWALAGPFDATKALVGALLLAGWVMCVRATWVSLGAIGVVLTVAILGTLVWWLYSMGWVARDATTVAWIALVAAGVLLGVAMGWSLLRQKATGQIEAD